MIRNCMIFGDILMALFAFPGALDDICYLFEYSGHFVSVTSLPLPFLLIGSSLKNNPAVVRYIQTQLSCAGSISYEGAKSF